MEVFDTSELSEEEKAEWILAQITKSKKYDMELLEDEAEVRRTAKFQIKIVMHAYKKGYTAIQIKDFMDIPLARVSWIIAKYEEQLKAKLIDESAKMLFQATKMLRDDNEWYEVFE